MLRLPSLILAVLFITMGAWPVRAAEVKLADGAVLSDKPFYIVTTSRPIPAKPLRPRS